MRFYEEFFSGGFMKFSDFRYIFEKMRVESKEEQIIVKNLIKNLGEFTNVKDTAKYLKVSKSYLYKMIDEKNIIFVEVGRRKIIYTRSLIVILR